MVTDYMAFEFQMSNMKWSHMVHTNLGYLCCSGSIKHLNGSDIKICIVRSRVDCDESCQQVRQVHLFSMKRFQDVFGIYVLSTT